MCGILSQASYISFLLKRVGKLTVFLWIHSLNSDKKNFISLNPIKPFIGLPNLHSKFQLRTKTGITALSEILAYIIIGDFNHPVFLDTIGFPFYPFMDKQVINQGAFLYLNWIYVAYFRDINDSKSFANGIHIG